MKKLFFILLAFASITTFAQQGDYDTKQRASYAIQTDSLFIYKTDTIPVTDITYHEWSADGLTWRKTHVITDRYLRISNDVKETFAIIDLMGLYPYWLQDGNTIYNNPAYSDSVLVDVLTSGNIIADYYFLGTDSLSLLNINSGAGTDGYVLVKAGNNAEWQPVASGGGNIARNVGTLGYGVLNDTIGGDFKFRNVASIDTFINVTLQDSSIIVGFDGTGRKVNAGIGLSGGGTLGADITFNLYVPELPQMADTVDYAADWMIINDATDGTHYKIHPQDLLDVLGQYTDSIGIGLDGNKFYLKEPQTVSETSDNVADANGHSHRFNMSSFELIDLGDVTDTPTNGQYLKYSGGTWITDSPTTGASNVSLYVNDTLRESSIPLLNIKEATGVNVEYGGSGEVEISSHLPVTIAEASADLASIDGNQVLTINRQNTVNADPDFGSIYNWYAATDSRKITSSDDWRIPTKYDAFDFADYFMTFLSGDTSDAVLYIGAEKILREGDKYWDLPVIANDTLNFGMVGGGFRWTDGFYELKMFSAVILSTQGDAEDQYWRMAVSFDYDDEILYLEIIGSAIKSYEGNVIRLVRDASGPELDLPDGSYVDNYVGNNGEEYLCVKISDKIWTAQNLRETQFRNGDFIDGPYFTDAEWAALDTSAYCIYQQTFDDRMDNIDHNSTVNKDGGDPDNNYFGHVTAAQQALITEENIIHQNRELLDSITAADTTRWGTKYYPAQNLTAAEVVFDFAAGNNGLVRLESDIELTLQNIPDGAIGSIVLLQDSTGGYVIDSLKSADVYIFVQNDTINQDVLGRTLMEYRRVANSLYVTYLIFPSNPINAPPIPSDTEYAENYTGTIYYFATDGSDSNDGLSKTSPKQTLSEASSLTLSSGDAVLFKSTDSFEGTVTAQSGVSYGAYGVQSSKPVIYGSDEITGWLVHSGDIYKASYATTINQLFVNDQRLLASREPDSGFFTVDAAPTTSQITSDELNGALNYTGTQCIIHSSSYGIETKAVTGSSSTTITLASAPFGDVTADEKFILVGKLEFLDEAGEWYYDAAADLVYVWLPDSADPSGYTMRGSVTDYGLTASTKSNFTVKDIQFEQQKTAGLSLTSSTDYTVNNVVVNYPDQEGIVDYNCENGTYTNNAIAGANHQGIESETSDSMLVQNNTISNIALFENLGLSGIGAWYNGSGIYSNGNGNEIYSNRLDEIGYDGVAFYGVNTVKYNYVTNFCRTKNDGGGIYTSAPVDYGNEDNKGSIVEYNTILYGWGVTTNVAANANGIYLDESSGGITVRYNNVGYCSGWGIFFHKGNNHVGTDNVLFANATGFINAYKGDYTAFKNNYIYGLSGQLLAQHVNSSPVVTTSDIDSNYYVNHYNTLNFNVDWGGSKNFAYWTANTDFDLNTAYDTLSLGSGIDEKFIVNSTANPVTWYKNNSESVVDAFTGDTLEATYVLQPYSSKVITGKYIGLFLPYADDSIPPVPTVTDSLIAWYDFEDAGTVLVDEHTNNLDGTNKNSSLVDRNVTPVTGLPGNAYPYISTGLSRSLVPDNALLNFTDEFSISAFVNVTSIAGIRPICSKQNEFAFSVTTTGALEMRVYENGGTTYVTISSPTSAIATGNDYFVEVKALGTNLKNGYELYINGVKQTVSYAGSIAELTNGITDTANDFVVGYSYNMSATMYGNISQLVVHGYETPEEVSTDLYNSGAGINY